VQRRWTVLGDEQLATSIICEAELLYGLELKQSARLQKEYESILKGRLRVFPVDAAVAASFASMKATARRRGRLVSDFDLLIAATAKAHGLVLATLNTRHFAGIDGLAVENWLY
jgi:predicted nucleic acid-binding protein